MNKERELYELFEDHIIEQRDMPRVFPSVHGEGGHALTVPAEDDDRVDHICEEDPCGICIEQVKEKLNDAPGG